VTKYPKGDRQHIRQLIMQAVKEKNANKPPASARKLFRYLKEISLKI
jgi:ribosome-associated protein